MTPMHVSMEGLDVVRLSVGVQLAKSPPWRSACDGQKRTPAELTDATDLRVLLLGVRCDMPTCPTCLVALDAAMEGR